MPKNRVRTFALCSILVCKLLANAQPPSSQPWIVRPEWVRAHENFLASDALVGRGSATRDEQIAAEYVASQFLAYGLKPAPGATSMMQTADVLAPELDGRSTLTTAAVTLEEGFGLRLMVSYGVSAGGPLMHLAASDAADANIPKGAVVLLTGIPSHLIGFSLASSLQDSGASVILFEEDSGLRGYLAKNPHPRFPMRLKPEPGTAEILPATIAALDKAAFSRMHEEKDGAMVLLSVHPLPVKVRRTSNAFAYLEGSDPASGTVLLSAHLDHLGVVSKPVNGDAIYNGANDDASGVTAVLELAHALAGGPQPKRSILFACFGSEEPGELGSQYFAAHSPVPLSQIVADLEFEMIGSPDPHISSKALFLSGWDRSNLGPTLRAHGAPLSADPYPEQHFFERSDNYQLALQGVVAHMAAGWGLPPTYHQPSDDVAHLNFDFMTATIQSFIEPVRWLANSDFKPVWTPGAQPRK